MRKANPRSKKHMDLAPLSGVRHGLARRRLLRSLAAGGAAVTVRSLPGKWAKPVSGSAVLPAHAQATCQAESLDCVLNDVDFAGNTDGGISTDLPIPGGNNTDIDVTVGGLVDMQDSTGCGFGPSVDGQADQISFGVRATVRPPCPQVMLNADLSGDSYYSLESPTSQVGVVDPDSGAVSFPNVTIGFDLAGYTVDQNENLTATLDLRFEAPGVSPCIIDINFTENFNCVE